MALPTKPVAAKNGTCKIEVNALLDDTSNKTYLSADITAQLGLERETKTMDINVLNGQVETFDAVSVD